MPPVVDRDTCMFCGACVGTCPFNSMLLREVEILIDDTCTDCRLCTRVCPVGALVYPT